MLSLLANKMTSTASTRITYQDAKTIEIRNLTLKFNERTLLDDISIDFQRGQFSVLLGPNGTGKSTLLKTLTGELPHLGEIKLFGQNRCHWPTDLLAKHVGVLPQSNALSFNFITKEVVELGGMGLSISSASLEEVIRKNMEKTDTDCLAPRHYPTLSGGEKQRVHLARILTQIEQSNDNTIVLLDEPTSALDLQHQHATLRTAKALAHHGATVIAVLHDINLAAQYADRIVILNQGNIVRDDTPHRALTPTVIEEVYRHRVDIITHPVANYPIIISKTQ